MAQGRYYGRQRSYSSLTADIEDFVRKTDERMLGVMRNSLQDVVINSQTPVAKGGRMRVDTGFLRASGRASLDGWPSGQSIRPAEALPNSYSWDGAGVTKVLNDMKLGDTFFFGWVANYAEFRELYDGFMEASMQNWARYVAFHTDALRKRIK